MRTFSIRFYLFFNYVSFKYYSENVILSYRSCKIFEIWVPVGCILAYDICEVWIHEFNDIWHSSWLLVLFNDRLQKNLSHPTQPSHFLLGFRLPSCFTVVSTLCNLNFHFIVKDTILIRKIGQDKRWLREESS